MSPAVPRRQWRLRVAAWSAAAVAAVALTPAAASAAVTSTKITSPAADAVVDATVNDLNFNTQAKLTVTGTATVDGQPGPNQVVVVAQAGNIFLFGGGGTQSDVVDVQPDGSFTTEIETPMVTSNLRALPAPQINLQGVTTNDVPEDTDDVFVPTRVLGGFFASSLFGDSPEFGGSMFLTLRGQRRGYFMVGPTGFEALGGLFGGVTGGPMDANGIDGSLLFFGTSALWPFYNDTRGAITVDGVRGYPRNQITTPNDGVLTSPTVTRTFDPATGGQTIVESQVLYVAVDQGDYPEDNPLENGYRPSGLELRRTVVQDHDGARATVTDVFRSTDGKAHKLDLLYAEGLGGPFDGRTNCECGVLGAAASSFAAATSSAGKTTSRIQDPSDTERPAFQIPWETGTTWETKSLADPLSAPPGERSSVFLRVPPTTLFGGPALGEQEGDDVRQSSYGAITFGTRPDGGVFVISPYGTPWFGSESGATAQFVARFVRDVPGGGSTPITQVYSQATTEAEAKALAADAERELTPSTPPAPPNTPPAGPPTPPATPAPHTKVAVPLPTTRIRPSRLTIKATPKRDKAGPRRFRFTGRLVLRKHSRKAKCRTGGRVSVQVRAGRNTISTRRVRLSKKCRYRVRITFRSKKRFGHSTRLTVKARWSGNSTISSKSAKSIRVRVR